MRGHPGKESELIDIAATRIKFQESGRKIQTYASAKGFNPAHWQQKFAGHVRFNQAELDAMREDGLLVEDQSGQHNKPAA